MSNSIHPRPIGFCRPTGHVSTLAALIACALTLSGSSSFGAVLQEAYIKASNPGLSELFGNQVAIAGDTLVVGAPREGSDATGVNGDQNNDRALDAGAAYVFVRSGTGWMQQAYLKASTTITNGNGYLFGSAVAVSGDTMAVGAPRSREGGLFSFGAVYIFVRNGTEWTQQAFVTNFTAQGGDNFAQSLALSGDTLVVGAFGDKSNATGVNGNHNNTSLFGAGAAYVFVRSGTRWTRQAYLKASNTAANDNFGWSVALSDNTVVVGAREEDSNATGVNGDEANNSRLNSGAAYVFVRNGTTWSQQAYLKASDSDLFDEFGYSVGVSGDTVVVGAYLEDSNATGINGDPSNNDALDSGAAFVFVRQGTEWTQQAYLKASNTETADQFGLSVAIFGDLVLVGADQESSNATGVNGPQNNNHGSRSGAAYAFIRKGTSWTQLAYLKASNTGGIIPENPSGDHFGFQVAVADDSAVVGAPFETSNAPGVNGNQSDNSLPGAGAAYVFGGLGPMPQVRLVLGYSENALNLNWSGEAVLEAAELVTGPWLPMIDAVSPHQASPTNPQHYFRLRLREP